MSEPRPTRWRFAATGEELVAKRAAEQRIAAFWRAFTGAALELGAALDRAAFDERQLAFMREQVAAVHPALEWEASVSAGRRSRLVLTSPMRALRPFVDALVSAAPSLDGWEVLGHRQPAESVEIATQLAAGRSSAGARDWQVRVWREGSRARLCYVAPREAEEPSLETAFALTEALVGEEDTSRWVGGVEIERASLAQGAIDFFSGRPPRLQLGALRGAIDSVREQVLQALPDRPWCEVQHLYDGGWITRFTPERARDHAGACDLLTASSFVRDFFPAAASPLFSSSAFSRCGETFVYVKIDATGVPLEARVEHRARIEEAIAAEIEPVRLGCQVGAGLGSRYSYIHLALIQLERGIEALCRVLRARQVPERSWILFLDPELEAEWVGIHPSTPAPP